MKISLNKRLFKTEEEWNDMLEYMALLKNKPFLPDKNPTHFPVMVIDKVMYVNEEHYPYLFIYPEDFN